MQYRTEDIWKTYNSGASAEVYRVSFPPLTLPFLGRVGGYPLYPPLEGQRSRCLALAIPCVFPFVAAM